MFRMWCRGFVKTTIHKGDGPIFDTQIWYDKARKMEFYYKLRELQACKEKQARTVIAQEKVQLNTQMKKLIEEVQSYYKE